MLLACINSAMKKAEYELLPDEGQYYGQIPGFQGVWANGPTLESCREELQQVLEDWILVSVAKNLPLPVVDGMELKVKEVA
jgi:predicted RNase H-like HicB family nuclease